MSEQGRRDDHHNSACPGVIHALAIGNISGMGRDSLLRYRILYRKYFVLGVQYVSLGRYKLHIGGF